MFDLPALGCAKSRLHGEPGGALAGQRGSVVSLRDGADEVGCVVRTQDGVKPLYVSPGHRMDTATAARLVVGACTSYRIPEPLRAAHMRSITLRAQGADALRGVSGMRGGA
jgi:deoxyribonuclease V